MYKLGLVLLSVMLSGCSHMYPPVEKPYTQAVVQQKNSTDGSLSFWCKDAIAKGDSSAINLHCSKNSGGGGLSFWCKDAIAKGDSSAINLHCSKNSAGGGMSFWCKDAIAKGDSSAIKLHCN